MTFAVPGGLNTSTQRVSLSVSNIITPRSLRPSSGFTIYTRNAAGFIVDAGGQDITVTMDTVNHLTDLQIDPIDKTNGASSSYKFTLETFVPLHDGDILSVELPEELSQASDI